MNSTMQGFWQNAKRNTFTLMYLMSETSVNERSHHVEIALGIFILFVDFFQTLRTALSPSFGWSTTNAPIAVVRAFDFVDYGVQLLDTGSVKVISVICIVISSGAITNACYCLWQISTNQLDRIWTFKNLRSTVVIVVTTMFPNFLEFAISPLTCSFWTDLASTCSPFAFPQVVGTLITLIVVVSLLLFSIACALLFQEIDLLTYDPIAAFHGEVNAGYLILQCVLIFVPVISSTTSALIPALLFIGFSLLAAYVLRVLPFMFRATNFIKVSMFCVLAWTNLCTVLRASGVSMDTVVLLFLLGSFFVAILGVAAVHWRCKDLAATADKLASSRPFPLEETIGKNEHEEPSKPRTKLRSVINAVVASNRLATKTQVVPKKGALVIEFAEVSPVSRYMGEHEQSAFFQAIDAVAAAKVLLWRKSRGELVKIKSLLRTSMIQHGKSDSVALFSLCFVYYIEEDIDRVTLMLDSVKDLNLSLTNEFLKFSISRSLIQRYKSTHVGGMVSAIGLLEFTKVQDEASRLHRSCLRTLRSFWRSAGSGQDVSVLSDHLKEFLACYQTANSIMNDMLLKYPNSVMLLRSYATFLQDISNDTLRSNELFQKAEMLSNMQDEKPDADQQASRSSGGPTQNQRAHWTTHVMSKDISIMTNVSSYMTWTLLLLLFVCATVFFILDFYFIKSAESLVGNIFELNIARSETMRSMYFMRSAYLHGINGDLNSVTESQKYLLESSSVVSQYISGQPFTDDVADYIYFTKQLYYENSGNSISQRSLQCGQIVFLFCDAATKVAQESPLNFQDLNNLDSDNFLKRNLVFGALNFFDPVVQIFEATSLLLEGQVTQFVFLSIVFFVVASIVCVMLGLHMIVLARRLLSDAGVLMRSSTICIVAALNINTSTRKFISKYYTDLDQNFQATLGEDAQTYVQSSERGLFPLKEAAASLASAEPTAESALSENVSTCNDSVAASHTESVHDPDASAPAPTSFITKQNIDASLESNTLPGSMLDSFLVSSMSNVESSILETAVISDIRPNTNIAIPKVAPSFLDVSSPAIPVPQLHASLEPAKGKTPSPRNDDAVRGRSPELKDAVTSEANSPEAWALVSSKSSVENVSKTVVRSAFMEETPPLANAAAASSKNDPPKEQPPKRAPSKPQSAPPQNIAPQPGRVTIEKILRQSNKVAPAPALAPAPAKHVVHAGNGAIAINHLRKSKNATVEEADDAPPNAEQSRTQVEHAVHDDIVLEMGASMKSSDAKEIADHHKPTVRHASPYPQDVEEADQPELAHASKPAKPVKVSFVEDGSSADGQSEHRDSRRPNHEKHPPVAAGGSNSSVSSIEGSERRSKKMRILAMLALFIIGIVALNVIILNYIQPVAIGSTQYTRIIDMLDLIADLLPPGGYIIEPLLNSLIMVGISSSSIPKDLDQFKTRYVAARSQFFITNLNWLSSVDSKALRDSFSDQNVYAKEFFSYVDRDVVAQLSNPDASRNGLLSKSYTSFNRHREAVNTAVAYANEKFLSLSVSGSSLVLSTVNTCISVSVAVFAVCGFVICIETFRVYVVFALKSIWHRIIPDEQFEAIRDQFAVGGFEWDLNHPRNFRACIIFCVGAFVSLILMNMGVLGYQANLVLIASDPYKELETAKLLIADILPPPMYLIEMYVSLVIGLEMSTRPDVSFFDISNSTDSWMPRVDTLIGEYKTRETFWSSRFSDEFMSDALSRELFPSAQQLISDYQDFVIPLISAGNITAAREYVYGPLKERFLAHRTAVKNLISLSNRELIRSKSSSLYGIKSVGLMVYGSATAILVIIIFLVSILLRQKVSNQLELSNAVSDPSSVVHSLFPKLRQEANRSRNGLSDNAVAVVFGLLIILQILSIGLPIRFMSSIQQLSPIANQQGRILSLLYFGTYNSREAFIADDLTSYFLQTQDLDKLSTFSTSELRSVYQSVRNGADYGIAKGRHGSQEILSMFDSPTCLLEKGSCDASRIFNSARSNGLAVLINSLIDSFGRIQYIVQRSMNATTASSSRNKFRLFRSINDAMFIESAVFTDSSDGLRKLDQLQRNAQVLIDIHFELRLMFGLTVAYAVFIFYFFAFRRTVSDLISEAVESRIFLRTIPMEKVPKSQSTKLFELFFSSGYEEIM